MTSSRGYGRGTRAALQARIMARFSAWQPASLEHR
jgi:hypothetical protein